MDHRRRIGGVKLSAFWNETSATRPALNQIMRKAPLTWPSLSTGKEGLHPLTSPAVLARRHSTRKRSRSCIASQFHRRPPKWPAHKSALSSRSAAIFRVIDNLLWHWRLIASRPFRLCTANRPASRPIEITICGLPAVVSAMVIS